MGDVFTRVGVFEIHRRGKEGRAEGGHVGRVQGRPCLVLLGLQRGYRVGGQCPRAGHVKELGRRADDASTVGDGEADRMAPSCVCVIIGVGVGVVGGTRIARAAAWDGHAQEEADQQKKEYDTEVNGSTAIGAFACGELFPVCCALLLPRVVDVGLGQDEVRVTFTRFILGHISAGGSGTPVACVGVIRGLHVG